MKLVLSFDIENKYDGKTDLITAENIPGQPGVRWIMDKLEEHGHKGVFFVNIYEHKAYPDDFFPELLREIRDRGHEAALHMHHESMFEDKKFHNYSNLSIVHKKELIAYGIEYFKEHLGQAPVSYRAGAWVIDNETFDVLQDSEIQVDSSLCFGYNLPGNSWFSNKNRIDKYLEVQLPHKIRPKLWEVPVSTIGRATEYRNFSMDHFHLASIKSALMQMQEHKLPVAVMVGHSFSFLEFGDKKTQVLGPDLSLMESFSNLLAFIKSEPNLLTTTFADLAGANMNIPLESNSFVPQVENRWIGRKVWDTLKSKSALLDKSNVNPNSGKTVWLHIGTWKTGTTSIQKFLRNNSDWLEENDYYLPVQDELLNAHSAKFLCNHGPVVSGDLEVLKVLKRSILNTDKRNIVLTSENIIYADPEKVRQLRVALAGCDVRIVVYLRRQDQYIQSLYGQHIRGGVKTTLSFDEHLKQHHKKYEYDELLASFSGIFGQENIVVRPYEKEQWLNGNLIEDFAHTIGLPALNENLIGSIVSTNFPVSIAVLHYIREANKHELADRAQLIRLLGQYSKETENLSVGHTHNWISGSRQQEIIDEFRESNAKVAGTYLNRDDGMLFYATEPSIDEPGFDETRLVEEIMKISMFLWNHGFKKND